MHCIQQYSEMKNVLRRRQKTEARLEGSRKRFGSELHVDGPATANARPPYESRRCGGTVSWWLACSWTKTLSWHSLRDWCPVCWRILQSSAVLASTHHHAESVLDALSDFACIGALGTPPAERGGPSLECIYRVSLTVDLYEGNNIISFKNFTTTSWGPLKKKKNPGALGTCSVCPLVKTALLRYVKPVK